VESCSALLTELLSMQDFQLIQLQLNQRPLLPTLAVGCAITEINGTIKTIKIASEQSSSLVFIMIVSLRVFFITN
jgi:hypothetical protein